MTPSGPPSRATRDLWKAVFGKDVERVRRLIGAGGDVNYAPPFDEPTLHRAVRLGSADVVHVLLEAKANTEVRLAESKEPEDTGMTALMEAARRGHRPVIQLLLDARAKVSAATDQGRTALMFAAANGNVEAIRMLLRAGADVNAQTKRDADWSGGRTALFDAIKGGHPKAIQALLDARADVNHRMTGRGYAGFTPLMLAARNGNAPLTDLLLKAGADPKAKNDAGLTAADLARKGGHRKLAAQLAGGGGP